jgi:phosphoribosylamine--glycine ligase
MNILIIGSGAREHAFCWKIAQSKKVDKVYVVPGNAGTSEIATNLNFEVSKHNELKHCILKNNIKLVLIGPEIPLIKE